jgi:hypothetical protein
MKNTPRTLGVKSLTRILYMWRAIDGIYICLTKKPTKKQVLANNFNHLKFHFILLYKVYTTRLSKRTFLGKNDRPDVHFVRSSTFIVRTASSARFYLADAVISTGEFLLRPRVVKLCPCKCRPRLHGRVSASAQTQKKI